MFVWQALLFRELETEVLISCSALELICFANGYKNGKIFLQANESSAIWAMCVL